MGRLQSTGPNIMADKALMFLNSHAPPQEAPDLGLLLSHHFVLMVSRTISDEVP
jgi:hypothetical protein